MTRKLMFIVLFNLLCICSVFAQTTEFTYQGRLIDGALPANADYDLEFRLFDVDTGGTALGTQTRLAVAVSNGIFTVRLDFGAQFTGSNRWIEIAVKPAASGSFTTLNPRQPVSSAPYSIRSLNSAVADTATNALTATNSLQLGGVAANQYVVTTDPRMTDARNPLPNSGNYVQNGLAQQAASNFNIAGNGTANIFSAATQYNMGNNRLLAATGSANTIAGIGAGTNATGDSNTFFGRSAGGGLTNSGNANSFFGERAGVSNTTGVGNAFFGSAAGVNNTTGTANAFFGLSAGQSNLTASSNSFFGAQAGFGNTTGTNNSYFGRGAGIANTTGNSNAFFGFEAGMSDTFALGSSFFGASAGRLNTGLFNSFFGFRAGQANTDGENNAFFGYEAGQVNTASNNTFIGSLAGLSNTTGSSNTFVGDEAGEATTTGGRNTFIGRWAGNSNTLGADNTFVGFNTGLLNTTGSSNVFIGIFAGSILQGNNNTIIGSNAGIPNGLTLQHATAIGADAEVSSSNTIQLGRANGFDTLFAPGLIRVGGLGGAGATDVCRNASNQLSTCSSSLRYKTDVRPFYSGLDVVRRLRPISFTWSEAGIRDVGFAAEEVEQIEPLLTTYNKDGQIEGVKYKQITTVLVNAVNEQQSQISGQLSVVSGQQKQIDKQQTQIETLEQQIKRQRSLIENLRKAVCSQNPEAEVCK
ncbi:MAG: tail fiber domain-containing protein [Pyrinomonadaceae bacterium]